MNVNSVASYLRGKNRDVAVSYEDYLEITDCLLDQYLSREMMMNFKNCTEATHYEMTFVPIYAAPFAGLMTKFLFNFTDRKGGLYKVAPAFFILNEIMCCWYIYTKPLPKALFTKILADPGFDGHYIRSQLAQAKPSLWRKLSNELYRKNYRFPEMPQYRFGTEFPAEFVPPS